MTEQISFADWQAICNNKARYCRFLDSKQWDDFAALFTEDFVIDVAGLEGDYSVSGRDAAMQMVQENLATAQTAHHVHLPEMTRDGEDILVVWAMLDRVIWRDGPSISGYGTYHERWVKREGEWKIATLRLARYLVDM